MSGPVVIHGSYDYRLVAVSVAIALLTAFTTLDLAGRVVWNQGKSRPLWLIGGAFAMGSGIWCMHYVGMLAYRLPLPVYYHLPTVALSLVAAILASLVALYVVSRPRMQLPHLLGGSLLMGAGVATMHYTGMAAMRMQAMHHYDRTLWIVSVVAGVLVSLVGLFLISCTREENRSFRSKVAIASIIGLAIPVMHYIGMAAVSFVPMASPPDLSSSVNVTGLGSTAILMMTAGILAFTLLTSVVDRRLSRHQLVLENERKMLRALLDNIPDLMAVKDTAGRYLIANAPVAQILGVKSPEDVIGTSMFDYLPRAAASRLQELEQRVMGGESIFNLEEDIQDHAGTRMQILSTRVPLRNGNGEVIGIAVVAHDITQRKRNERALTEAERKYRGMFDDAIAGMFQLDPEGKLLSVNASMAHMLGYSTAEELLAGMAGPLWRLSVSRERRDEFRAQLQVQGFVKAFDAEVYRKDGDTAWISSSVRTVMQDGAVVRFEGMFEDITERRLLRDQLAQAQKLESVGQLAAGIAHEINTPMQYIGDNVRFLEETFHSLRELLTRYGELLKAARSGDLSGAAIEQTMAAVEDADLDFLLHEIPTSIQQTLEGVTRVSTLVSAMKEFSHPGTKEKIPLDLNHAIQSTITVARNEWKYVADLETELDPLLPLIACQPGEFNQVILNIIVNAAHAIGDVVAQEGGRGNIRVETRACPTWVEIRIEDTGGGIPEHARSRVFDPFFTTKEIGKGTGQGLAIARSIIVDKHSGSIDFESLQGVGTTFVLRLPYDGQVLDAKAINAIGYSRSI